MRRRVVILAAIVGWLVMAACVVTGVALRVLDPVPIIENALPARDGRPGAVAILAATWVSAGSLLMIRRPDNVVGRWVLLVGMGHAISVLAAATASSALALGAAGVDDGAMVRLARRGWRHCRGAACSTSR